jgi:hypothetical protein
MDDDLPLLMSLPDRHNSPTSEFITTMSGTSSVSAPSIYEDLHGLLDWSTNSRVVDVRNEEEDSWPNVDMFDKEKEDALFALSSATVRNTTYSEKFSPSRSPSFLTSPFGTQGVSNNNNIKNGNFIQRTQPIVQLLSKSISDGDSTMVSSYRIGSAVSISTTEQKVTRNHHHISEYTCVGETIDPITEKSALKNDHHSGGCGGDSCIDHVDSFGFKVNDVGEFLTTTKSTSPPTTKNTDRNDNEPKSPPTPSSLEVQYTSFSKWSNKSPPDDSVATPSCDTSRRVFVDDDDRKVVLYPPPPPQPRVAVTIQRMDPVHNKEGTSGDGDLGEEEVTVQDFLERLESFAGCSGNDMVDDHCSATTTGCDDGAVRRRLMGRSSSGTGWPNIVLQPKTMDGHYGIKQVLDLFLDCIEPPREYVDDLASPDSGKSSIVDSDDIPQHKTCTSPCVGVDADFSKKFDFSIADKGVVVDRVKSKEGIASPPNDGEDDAEWSFPFWNGQDTNAHGIVTQPSGCTTGMTPGRIGMTNGKINDPLRLGYLNPDHILYGSGNNFQDSPPSVRSYVESTVKDTSAVASTNKTTWATVVEKEVECTASVGNDSFESLSNVFDGLDLDPVLPLEDQKDDLNSVLGCLDESFDRTGPTTTTTEGTSSGRSTLNYSSFTS